MNVRQAFELLMIPPSIWHINVPNLNVHESNMKALAKKNYRTLSKKFHPDKPDVDNDETFKLIASAYEVIKKCSFVPNRRPRYVSVGISVGVCVTNIYDFTKPY